MFTGCVVVGQNDRFDRAEAPQLRRPLRLPAGRTGWWTRCRKVEPCETLNGLLALSDEHPAYVDEGGLIEDRQRHTSQPVRAAWQSPSKGLRFTPYFHGESGPGNIFVLVLGHRAGLHRHPRYPDGEQFAWTNAERLLDFVTRTSGKARQDRANGGLLEAE
jgi:hypothetical protein